MEIITSAKFIKSSENIEHYPKPGLPEYAFLGRSNVGKSSLINMLINRKNLARTSGSPGKTRAVNHFLINENWYLVDLPGYGFAKVSKSIKADWSKMIRDYISNRKTLVNTFLLIDSRIDPQETDLEMIQWFGKNQLPFIIVFTKADKPKLKQLNSTINAYREILSKEWEELPLSVISSAKSRKGREDILSFIHQSNEAFLTKPD